MKRVLNLVKKGLKWYVEQYAGLYPTGIIPM